MIWRGFGGDLEGKTRYRGTQDEVVGGGRKVNRGTNLYEDTYSQQKVFEAKKWFYANDIEHLLLFKMTFLFLLKKLANFV